LCIPTPPSEYSEVVLEYTYDMRVFLRSSFNNEKHKDMSRSIHDILLMAEDFMYYLGEGLSV